MGIGMFSFSLLLIFLSSSFLTEFFERYVNSKYHDQYKKEELIKPRIVPVMFLIVGVDL